MFCILFLDRDYTKLISVFAEIETCLNEIRSKIFIRIQPQLGCTLGKKNLHHKEI